MSNTNVSLSVAVENKPLLNLEEIVEKVSILTKTKYIYTSDLKGDVSTFENHCFSAKMVTTV